MESKSIDYSYCALLSELIYRGTPEMDRTGTGTRKIFGKTIEHNMADGFPLLTTKRMYWKAIVEELNWFLKGETNIKSLVDNDCYIWVGDAYLKYKKFASFLEEPEYSLHVEDIQQNKIRILSKEEFIDRIKTDIKFANRWGELGPIYGKQWRSWRNGGGIETSLPHPDGGGSYIYEAANMHIDQIANLISELKTNPSSRRLLVSAWNVGELDQMVLPPCHYSFQVYTRDLSKDERMDYWFKNNKPNRDVCDSVDESSEEEQHKYFDGANIPKRAISLLWNQRSVDTFLGLPFNIASYGLLLCLIAKEVDMIPEKLIGNLGDVHLYENHINQAMVQITRIPKNLPKIEVEEGILSRKNLSEIVKIKDYSPHGTIKADLSN